MGLPFDPERFIAYEIDINPGGHRLGCKFLLDDGSLLFLHESQITPEIKSLIVSLGPPIVGLAHGDPKHNPLNMKRR
jgi:hypothetical protein